VSNEKLSNKNLSIDETLKHGKVVVAAGTPNLQGDF